MPQTYKFSAVFLVLCSSIFSGCTTMKALEHSGEEFSQGNILSGLWSGTMGVFMGALVDVVTLGGTVSPDEGADILSSSAQDYNSARAQGNSSTAALSTALSSVSDRMAQANQNPVDDATQILMHSPMVPVIPRQPLQQWHTHLRYHRLPAKPLSKAQSLPLMDLIFKSFKSRIPIILKEWTTG